MWKKIWNWVDRQEMGLQVILFIAAIMFFLFIIKLIF